MKVIEYDEAGMIACPMKEVVTLEECRECQYFRGVTFFPAGAVITPGCCYEDSFPEPSEEK